MPDWSLADLELDEKVYKPDFEITAKYQAFSKELVRLSLLGLGAYGYLIKFGESGRTLPQTLQTHKVLGVCGIGTFALCASLGLMHGFLATKCLGYQLVISRYFGRLEGTRWDEPSKEKFREVIKKQQQAQRSVLTFGNWILFLAIVALATGAVLFAACSVVVLSE